jgi:hypothetical protein
LYSEGQGTDSLTVARWYAVDVVWRSKVMTPTLTEDQRLAIQEHGAPIYMLDETTNISYVLMRADEFESMKTRSEADEVSPIYPLIADISPEDWEDASNYGMKRLKRT